MNSPVSLATWPQGSGGMASRIRAHDWAATPLGAIEGWPDRLRGAVDLVLAHGLPMLVLWGPELVQIPNDGFGATLGAGPPGVLGRPLRERGPELRPLDEPALRRVRSGETLTLADALRPDARLALCCSPLRDGVGQVAGVLVTALEAPPREGEAREAFLLRLSDALRPLGDAAGIQGETARLLRGRFEAGWSFCAELDEARTRVAVAQGSPRDGLPSLTGWHDASDLPEVLALWRAGRVVQVDDVQASPLLGPRAKEICRTAGIASVLGAPVLRGGAPVAALVLADTAPRAWPPLAADLAAEAAGRAWEAVERARAEAAMRASEALFSQFADASTGILWVRDAESLEMRYASPAFEAVYGLAPAGLLARVGLRDWAALLHPDDRGRVLDNLRRVKGGERVTHEFRMRPPGGQERWIRNTDFPLRDAEGRIERIGGIGEDVTELKQAQAAIFESEQRLRGFAEASADVLWIIDAETRRLEYLSPAFEQVWGEGREAVMADLGRWAETVLPEDRAVAGGALDAALSGQRTGVEYRIRRPDGALRHVNDTGFPILGPDGRVRRAAGVAQDITERRRAELALQSSQRQLRSLMEGIPQLVWRAVDGGRWTWSSPQWEAYTGQSSLDSQGLGWLEVIHPDDRARSMEVWDGATASGVLAVEHRVCEAATGRFRWFQTRATPVRDDAGAIVEWLGTSTDVQDLRELQDRLKVLVAELQHRTRNLMSVVRSVADRTLAGSRSMEEFQGRFRDRMGALARVNGLLSRLQEGDRITFDELLRTELAGHGIADADCPRSPVRLKGPQGVRLRSAGVQTLALALHELATNALKHGALSRPEGRVAVSWALVDGDGGETRLRVDWTETGVRPEAGDGRRGAGAAPPPPGRPPGGGRGGPGGAARARPRRAAATAASSSSGRCPTSSRPRRATSSPPRACAAPSRCPSRRRPATAAPPRRNPMPWPDPSLPPSSPPPSSSSASSPPAPGAPSLRGRRILVAEDDYLLAGDLREMLERHGTQVLGPVPGVADALRLLEREAAPDAAVLDINLGGEMVYPLADALRARGVPFVFATGYDAWAIPDVYAAVPRFEKPVEARHVMQALASR